jgi:CRISPR-associated protein Cas2
MPETRVQLSEYRGMWLFVLFDLPVDTAIKRKQYTRFRKELLKQGFTMLQYSVYARYFASEDASNIHRIKVRAALPPDGQVRLLSVTDKQFGKMEIFFGKKREPTEDPPMQMSFF